MEIRISQSGLESAVAQLPAFNLRGKITSAIRATIADGKQEGSNLVKQRYAARSMISLGRVKSRTSGLSGKLTISGGRNLLKRFVIRPSTRINPQPAGGVFANVVKGQGGNINRAFIAKKGLVFERVGKSRLPIRHLNTVSLPGAFERIGDKLVSKMEQRLQTRLEQLL